MAPTVVIVGGGYGGITAAKALDDVADVVLIEPRDAFVHNVASLRCVVDLQWTDRLFYPYDQLLSRGRVVHERAVRVDPTGVELESGERIAADYIVLATGSTYPFPAKMDVQNSNDAIAKLQTAHQALATARSVLLLGAGPVGLEFAGEILAAWPDKSVTIVDPAPHILTGDYPDELRGELRRQLDELGVNLHLETSLSEPLQTQPGQLSAFTAALTNGDQITADIWFQCYGGAPQTDYLAAELASSRQANGQLEVTEHLKLLGQERVFALGDITAIPEAKKAKAASDHADVIAANIKAMIEGSGELITYQASGPFIALHLGPTGGASYTPKTGLLGAEVTSQLKGADLRVSHYDEIFGIERT